MGYLFASWTFLTSFATTLILVILFGGHEIIGNNIIMMTSLKGCNLCGMIVKLPDRKPQLKCSLSLTTEKKVVWNVDKINPITVSSNSTF